MILRRQPVWLSPWRIPAAAILCALLAALSWLAVCSQPGRVAAAQSAPPPLGEPFGKLISDLSEPGGYFDTDNLISNEKSFLHVIPELERRGVSGGVYLGVGPDQNFSYIARIRPDVAFIVDIRRDNLLMHLLMKAIFANAPTRVEYLCLLTGRAAPENLREDVPQEQKKWRTASIDQLLNYVDSAPARPGNAPSGGILPAQMRTTIAGFGMPLSADDYSTMERFHKTFISKGLSLQFQTFGRPIQSYNPTYRELLTETDREGHQRSFLASEDDYQFMREMEAADRVIPVVGDLAGQHAITAIAAWMRHHSLTLSAYYTSNVEDYLFRGDQFGQFMSNVQMLPHGPRSVIIRSIFGRRTQRDSMSGYYSTSTVQNLAEMITAYKAGKYSSYYELISE